MRRLIAQTFPAHGVIGEEYGRRSARCGICLGARSDRRHQELHFRHADLGHADRPHASRPAGLRHDGAAIHPRALLRRRQARAGCARSRPRAAKRRRPNGRRARCARALARRSPRRRSSTTSPALIRDAGRPRGLSGGSEAKARLSRYGGDCYAYCALAAGFVDLVIETEPQDPRHRRARADHRRRGRRHHDLGGRGRLERRTHYRRRRPARLRRGAEPAARVSLTSRRTNRGSVRQGAAPARGKKRDDRADDECGRRGDESGAERFGRPDPGGIVGETRDRRAERGEARRGRRERSGAPDRGDGDHRNRDRERQRNCCDQRHRRIDRPGVVGERASHDDDGLAEPHAGEPDAGEAGQSMRRDVRAGRRSPARRPGRRRPRASARPRGRPRRRATPPPQGSSRRSRRRAAGGSPRQIPARRWPGTRRTGDAGLRRRPRVAAGHGRRGRADQSRRADGGGDEDDQRLGLDGRRAGLRAAHGPCHGAGRSSRWARLDRRAPAGPALRRRRRRSRPDLRGRPGRPRRAAPPRPGLPRPAGWSSPAAARPKPPPDIPRRRSAPKPRR